MDKGLDERMDNLQPTSAFKPLQLSTPLSTANLPGRSWGAVTQKTPQPREKAQINGKMPCVSGLEGSTLLKCPYYSK